MEYLLILSMYLCDATMLTFNLLLIITCVLEMSHLLGPGVVKYYEYMHPGKVKDERIIIKNYLLALCF